MTAQKSGAQYLHDALDRGSAPAFEGSGCHDHVTRRNLYLTVAGAALGLLILLVILLA